MESLTPFQRKMLIGSILSASFLFLFNQFLLITAFPQIMADFGINATQVQWLTTSFLLTTTILIPTMGYFMGRFSTRVLTLVAIGFFYCRHRTCYRCTKLFVINCGPCCSSNWSGDDASACSDGSSTCLPN